MSGLVVTVSGWAAFALAAAAALRAWHAAVARGEALARACHEVRGPLAAAQLGLETSVVASSPDHLRAIGVELARAAVALDDLQEVERIVVQECPEGLVDVRAWLSDSVEAWRPVAAACGMEIQLTWRGPDALVWGQQSRLAQVTGNLIANALDHGDAFVEVRGQIQQATVVIEVVDGGPGWIAPPPALLPPGPQQRSSDRRGAKWGGGRIRGRGRGLLIARSVAEAHGGHLTTAPSQHGARLVLTLPLAEE
jgi:signal transduction histidine kinase